MSLRNRLILPTMVLALGILAGCGGSGNSVTNPTPPPGGNFSNSNLSGTYVFSASGTDQASDLPYAVVGTLSANGNGGITGGAIDMIDPSFSGSATNLSVIGSYKVGVDGRTQATLTPSTNPFGQNLVFDFVLQDSSHGLVIEFDGNATGSGSLDLQTSGATPTGSYAFLLSGADVTSVASGSVSPFVSVGNFAVGSNGTFTGLEDFNDNGFAYPNQSLNGTLVLGPSSSPATTMTTTRGTQTFDVFAVDANHLKFIETDGTATLTGDAFSQTNTALSASTLAFTLQGSFPGATTVSAAGGFLSIDGAGNVTNTSTVDVNNGGSVSPSPLGFSGTYAAAGTGRYTSTLTGFEGTQYAIYPFNGGLLLLEIDNSGIMAGVAYPQTSGATFSTSDGYGLNLSGANAAQATPLEVDDIAEFTGSAITGVIDENFAPGGGPSYGLALGSGSVTGPDSSGRSILTASAGNSSQSTLNQGFQLTFYAADGTTFPFIETDANGQIAAGVFVKQNASGASSAALRSQHAFVMQPIPHPHAVTKKAK